MKIKKAFTLSEILVSLSIIAIIGVAVVGIINKDRYKRQEYMGRFQMIVPQLSEIAAFTAQNADYFEEWWADSNSLSGLGCVEQDEQEEQGEQEEQEAQNLSVCLKQAFMSSSNKIFECDEDDCFPSRNNIDAALGAIFGQIGGFNANEMQVVQGVGGATYGLLYTDSSCRTQLRSITGGRIDACGVIFVDINGAEPPNELATANTVGDRFLLALTANGVKQTELSNAAAGCPSGTNYNAARKACVEPHQCTVSQEAVARAQALVEANAENPGSVSVSFPDGEEFADCITARCTMGVRPNADNLCPGSCPAGLVYEGGLFVSEGGDIDDLMWEEKQCCTPIETQDDLNNIRTNLAGTYCLMNDIELNFDNDAAPMALGNVNDYISWTRAEGWKPIGWNANNQRFTGRLYGNGHRISGLTINRDLQYIGLFGGIGRDAVIKDLILDNVDISSNSNTVGNFIGSLAAISNSSLIDVSNIIVNGNINASNVTADTTIGGFWGSSGTFENIINGVNITDSPRNSNHSHTIGGVVGSGSSINNAINLGNIEALFGNGASAVQVGGINGNSRAMTNVINNGNININSNVEIIGTRNAGGISGNSSGTNNNAISIQNGINMGTINVTRFRDNQNIGSITGNLGNNIQEINNILNIGNTPTIPMIGWANNAPITNFFYLTGTATRIANGVNGGVLNSLADIDANIQAENLPPQLIRDCRNLDDSGNPPANCYDVLNTPNTFIPAGDDVISVWAYRQPPYEAGFNMVRDALVFRWQCQPYKSEAEGGIDCCRPEYANWEPALDICPRP